MTYVLEGSVRKAAGRVRVVLHLIDSLNGSEIWSDRLDDTLDDIFALQDRVARARRGRPRNHPVGRRHKKGGGPADHQYEQLRPLSAVHSPVPPVAEGGDKFPNPSNCSIGRSNWTPSFAIAAMSQSCVCHRQVIDHGWCDDPESLRRRGLELADHALRLAGDDARVLAQVAASLPGLEGSVERAITLMDRAIALNPASSFVWLVSGSVRLRAGDPERAAEHLETSIRLDPISATTNPFARMYLASARFQQGRFDEALALFRSTVMRLPVSYAVLASLYGHVGQLDQAREALATFRGLTMGGVEEYADIWFPRPGYRKLFLDGIAMAEGKTVGSEAAG